MDRLWVKICGVTTLEDALCAADAGADAIGLNFVDASPRRITIETAAAIVDAVPPELACIGVVADVSEASARALRDATGLRWLQLHGHESPELLASLLPDAYKAIRIAEPADVAHAEAFTGDRLLVDAKVAGALGGSGRTFDWSLVDRLVASRQLILAGGLGPENVAQAVRAVRPWGVDTASGVEQGGNPRRKDRERVLAFVRAARGVES